VARAIEGVVEDALKKIILGAAVLVLVAAAAGGTVLWRETHLPTAWRVFVILAAALLIVGEVAVIGGTLRYSARTRRLQLANVGELEDNLAAASYAQEFVGGILDTLQAMIEAEEAFGYERFAEDAVLEPARVFLTRGPLEQVRLSVLTPRDEHSFGMKWCVGHRPNSQAAFRLPIDGSVAGEVFRSGQRKVIDKVSADPSFLRLPAANRPYETLACLPLKLGDRVGGLLNAVSTYEAAFTEADILFLELVGAVISFLWALEREAEWDEDEPGDEDEPEDGSGRAPA
jgi:hypothetical protein